MLLLATPCTVDDDVISTSNLNLHHQIIDGPSFPRWQSDGKFTYLSSPSIFITLGNDVSICPLFSPLLSQKGNGRVLEGRGTCLGVYEARMCHCKEHLNEQCRKWTCSKRKWRTIDIRVWSLENIELTPEIVISYIDVIIEYLQKWAGLKRAYRNQN